MLYETCTSMWESCLHVEDVFKNNRLYEVFVPVSFVAHLMEDTLEEAVRGSVYLS